MATRIYSAGELDQKVQFQRRAEGRNGMNEKVGAWVNDGDERFAKVEVISASEVAAAGSGQARMRATVVIRFSASRTSAQIKAQGLRLVWKGRALDIQGAEEVGGKREWIAVDVIEGVRDGR